MCNRYGNRGFGVHQAHFGRNFGGPRDFRVPVNIIKNDTNYELFVFAPDRAKDDFKITLKGNELSISYALTNDTFAARNWIRHEFSKTAFERSFVVDQTVDTENIHAEYINGILQLTLPIIPGSEKPAQDITIS
jgi:HSP20 family protein